MIKYDVNIYWKYYFIRIKELDITPLLLWGMKFSNKITIYTIL